jgi:nucleoside-diphosphate-sugar epimerase
MVLLTGATGFLGSFVLDELVKHDFEVLALFRRKHPIMEKYPSVRWLQGDLRDADSLDKLPIPSEGIIHLASTLSLQPTDVLKVDIPGSWGLMNKWGEGPFVFVSSTDVYGNLQKVPTTEEHPLTPSHWYGFGKLVCEQQLQMAARIRNRSDFVIFRPPYILGPHEKFPLSLIGRLITRAMASSDFVLPEKWHTGNVNAGHSWVNAYDLARWIVDSLRNGLTGTYNAASGFVTWKTLVEQILALTGSSGRIIFKGNGARALALCDQERCFSNKKLTRAFHIRRTTPLKQTLIKLIAESRLLLAKGQRDT